MSRSLLTSRQRSEPPSRSRTRPTRSIRKRRGPTVSPKSPPVRKKSIEVKEDHYGVGLSLIGRHSWHMYERVGIQTGENLHHIAFFKRGLQDVFSVLGREVRRTIYDQKS